MKYKSIITALLVFPLLTLANEELGITKNQGISLSTVSTTCTKLGKWEAESARPKKLRQQARVNLKRLHEGTLLVRLKTEEKKIAALESKGKTELAERTRSLRREQNLRIVDAFQKHYTFSKVVFFFNTDSRKVLEHQWEGIFLDNNLERDPSIRFDTTQGFYIGEIDVLEADTAKHADMPYWDPNTKKMEHTYYGSPSDFSRCALVIRDRNFIQLRRPFPYYVSCESEQTSDMVVRTINTAIKPSVYQAVEKMNKKLHKKYRKYFGK